jgi:Zn-dependent alcohol dehydrogenase
VVDVELDAPKHHEVLVRLHASGVCHSDQNAIDGTAETRCPAVLGHEGAGVVEAVGPGVTAVAPGDRVALSWLPACGVCEECRRDLPHLCAAAFPAMDAGGLLDGTTRLSHDGRPAYHYSLLSTFAEHTVVPEASCIPIPADVPFDVAALVGCAITTGVCAAWRTARVAPGERVAVFGCGGVGLSAVMIAVAAGARVVAVDVEPAKLERARELGAEQVVDASREDAAEAVASCTGGGAHVALDALGSPETLAASVLGLRRHGRHLQVGLLLAGDERPPVPMARVISRELSLHGVHGMAVRHYPGLLAAVARGELDPGRLVGRTLALADVGDELAAMGDFATRGLSVVDGGFSA